jgi:protein required for attachment to host cells
MRHPRTWYLVADGGRARVLQKRPAEKVYDTQLAIDATSLHSQSRDLGADRPGRTHESMGSVRHALAPRQDLHLEAKRTFIHDVANLLNQANARGEFDRLVLVAPTPALGQLHAALDPATQHMVVAQLQKDLTNVPDADLAPHFADLIGI